MGYRTAESGLMTADTIVKAAPGRVFGITIGFKGVTAGQFCTLVDAVSGSTGDKVVFVFGTTEGTITKTWPDGKFFATGIVYNKGATTGDVYAELQYQ